MTTVENWKTANISSHCQQHTFRCQERSLAPLQRSRACSIPDRRNPLAQTVFQSTGFLNGALSTFLVTSPGGQARPQRAFHGYCAVPRLAQSTACYGAAAVNLPRNMKSKPNSISNQAWASFLPTIWAEPSASFVNCFLSFFILILTLVLSLLGCGC